MSDTFVLFKELSKLIKIKEDSKKTTQTQITDIKKYVNYLIKDLEDCCDNWMNKIVCSSDDESENDKLFSEKIEKLYYLHDVLYNTLDNIEKDKSTVSIKDKTVLSEMMKLCFEFGIFEDDGVGKRFCYNPLETCHCDHDEEFKHFDADILEELVFIIQFIINTYSHCEDN